MALDRQQMILTPKSADVDVIPALWGDIPLAVNFYYEELPQGSFLSLPKEAEEVFAREHQYFVSYEELYLEDRRNILDFPIIIEDIINNIEHFGQNMLPELLKMRSIINHALNIGCMLIVIT
jgi:hypothetical protein